MKGIDEENQDRIVEKIKTKYTKTLKNVGSLR